MIEIRHSIFGYSRELVHCEHLELARGECYILLGRNGAGKSTILRTLIGETPLMGGQIIFENKDIESLLPQERSKLISYVETKTPSIDHLSVFEYVALGRTPYLNPFAKLSERDHEMIHDSLDLTGLLSFKGRLMSELSDGERQLASISKAIAQETPCILLDEPTAFLDYANKRMYTELASKIAVEMNKCILMTSHDVELALASESVLLGIDSQTCRLVLYDKKPELKTIIQQIYNHG